MSEQNNNGLLFSVEQRAKDDQLFRTVLEKLVSSTSQELTGYLQKDSHLQIILKLVDNGHNLFLEEADGSRLLCDRTLFKSINDREGLLANIDKRGMATLGAFMQVHDVTGQGRFLDIFKALPGSWGQKKMSRHQLINFIEEVPECLQTADMVHWP